MNTKTESILGIKSNFAAGYEMLPAKFQNLLKDRIMSNCGWKSLMTFHNKRKGVHLIRPPEKLIIEREFLRYNINPWTGENLKGGEQE